MDNIPFQSQIHEWDERHLANTLALHSISVLCTRETAYCSYHWLPLPPRTALEAVLTISLPHMSTLYIGNMTSSEAASIPPHWCTVLRHILQVLYISINRWQAACSLLCACLFLMMCLWLRLCDLEPKADPIHRSSKFFHV